MNPELRLDRLERVLKLAIRAGYRERLAWRQQSQEQTEKINAMISTHMDAMDRLDKRAAESDERWAASRSEFDERMGKLAVSHVKFERRMNRLAARQEEFEKRMAASRSEFAARMDRLAASHERFDERMNKLMIAQDNLMIAQDNSDKKIDKLADEHAATERSLKALLDGLQKGQNGTSQD